MDRRTGATIAFAPVLPLAGVRVADLSRVLAGPYCTMALADLGADVVKIERPGEGDETRGWGPPFAPGGASAYFLSVNRRKRSLALDLSAPAGRKAALELCMRADVVVENFRPGGAERLGLGYDAVRAGNPHVVWCSITGFGSDRAPDRAGYDFIAQAESGLMHITGPPDAPPHKVGVALVDVLAGLNAAVAVLAALRRGESERIEVSLLDSALAALVNVAQGTLVTGEEAARHGNAHPSIVPYEPFRARDGWIAVAAANDGLFVRLCEALGAPMLADDPRFASNPARVRHRAELIPLLGERFATREVDAWLAALDAAGVPAGKIRGVAEALAAHAPTTMRVQHAAAGPLELVRPAFRLASADLTARAAPPPLLGEHTRAVLRELGCTETAIDDLLAAGVAAEPDDR
jgi:crotonobetainyl-CoA:carnitine CoA-transferase CaiB-like acyl-CoA transferase